MQTTKLDESEWRPFFDRMARRHVEGRRAEIDIASLDLGNQIAAEWLPLLGVAYDPKGDIVEVALEGFDHLINKPREIFVAEDAGRLSSIEVTDADDVRHIIQLKEPLMLSRPGAESAGGNG